MSLLKYLLPILCILLLVGSSCNKTTTATKQPPKLHTIKIAPVTIPDEIPFVGGGGTDEYGYPVKLPDKEKLLSLLYNKKFHALLKYLESYQSAFEKDFRKEYWPEIAFESFDVADPHVGVLLESFVKAHPKSYASYLARGRHNIASGYQYRGGKFIEGTSVDQIALMMEYFKKAIADLKEALKLNPKLSTAYNSLISIYRAGSFPEKIQSDNYSEAVEVCPECYISRLTYMWKLQPRWGGSLESMRQFAESVNTKYGSKNVKLKLLYGDVPYEECKMLTFEKRYDDALKKCNEAAKFGKSPYFYSVRGAIYLAQKRYDLSIDNYQSALKLQPQLVMVLEKYVTALVADKQYEKAASVMIDNLRLNPIVSKNEYEHYRYIVFKLIESGDAAFKAGKRDEALRLYAIAKVLDSSNERALKRYQGAKSGKGYTEVVEKPQNELLKKQETYGDRVKKLRGKISNEPSNFQAYVDLDHALARHHRFDEVVKMWDEYISKNQNDARAYLERGGAYFHSKDFARAYEDANKACKLGLDEGCKRAKQVAGKVPIGKLKSVK